jgi:hypothetical protein
MPKIVRKFENRDDATDAAAAEKADYYFRSHFNDLVGKYIFGKSKITTKPACLVQQPMKDQSWMSKYKFEINKNI